MCPKTCGKYFSPYIILQSCTNCREFCWNSKAIWTIGTEESPDARVTLWRFLLIFVFLLYAMSQRDEISWFLVSFLFFRGLLPLRRKRRSQFLEQRNSQDLLSTYRRSRILKVNWNMSPKRNSSSKGEKVSGEPVSWSGNDHYQEEEAPPGAFNGDSILCVVCRESQTFGFVLFHNCLEN